MSDNLKFNKDAKEYVPKTKKTEPIEDLTKLKDQINEVKTNINENKDIKFNLEAKEYKPKKEEYKVEALVDDEEEEEEPDDDIFDDMIQEEGLNNPIPDEDEESDEDKWFPKYKDCTCCTGYIYKCNGDVCQSLGVCYCKAHEDFDPEDL